MGWFPSERDTNNGWKFDIVSLVAVIGESTIERHVQLITASTLSYLPRLLPAPQILLKTERPTRLPPVKGIDVFGVYSGTYVSELNFFADVIHKIEELEPYEYRKYKITYTNEDALKTIEPAQENDDERSDRDIEHGNGLEEIQTLNKSHRTQTLRETEENQKRSKIETQEDGIPINNPFRWRSMLTVVTIVSVLMMIGLFVWAGCIHDGVAMIALATMSFSTSLACWASKWHPVLSPGPTSSSVPPGDVVIKSRSGAFVVVECPEGITRELYTCADKCQYEIEGTLLLWVLGISTVLLMASIIFFSNCGWPMQTAIGMAYIILNMMYWVIPFMMKEHTTWDLKTRYDIRLVEASKKDPDTVRQIQEEPGRKDGDRPHDIPRKPNYTQTLWYAIWETQSIKWVKDHKVAPSTEAWNEWLDEALKKALKDDCHWDAVKAKDEVMARYKKIDEDKKAEQARQAKQNGWQPKRRKTVPGG